MGALYVAMILSDDVKDWLRQEAIAFPEVHPLPRWPTMRELRAALASLTGHTTEYSRNGDAGWDIAVTDSVDAQGGSHATIWTKNVHDEDTPTQFSFHKPHPELAIAILRLLTPTCGPFAFIDTSSMETIVVTADAG